MRVLLTVMLAFATSAPATPPQPIQTKSPVIVDAKGEVARFHGIPMNLTPAGLKRVPYRYKVGHGSSEGIPYTFYTIRADGGVEVVVGFDHGRLSSAATSSPNAVGPMGIRVGSLLSEVKRAWPKGKLYYGVEESHAFVTFETAEAGFMSNVLYRFDPEDVPAAAFDRDFQKSRQVKIPDIKVRTIEIFPYEYPEATYDFFAVTTRPCAAKSSNGAKQPAGCDSLTPKRRYRGTLFAFGDTFRFAPVGRLPCTGDGAQANCAAVEGNMWIRGDYDAQCPRLYRVELLGRRNALPNSNSGYRIKVDEILAYAELDLPNEPAGCARPWRSS